MFICSNEKTKAVSQTTVIGALLNIVCNFIFIYFWGAVGAAFSTMLGYGTTWILRTIYLRRFIDMKVNWTKHAILIASIIVQAVLATFNVLNVLQVLIFIVILLLHKEYIRRLFKSGIIKIK